jgi:type VI secretion system protein VasD
MHVITIIGRFFIATSLMFLISCSTPAIMGDGITDLTLRITVADDVNPDENGRASPVFLQVLELRDTNVFKNADYLDLYRDARAELGASYVYSTEIGPLFPNTTRTEKIRINTVTSALGFLGEFNHYINMQTTQSMNIVPGDDLEVNLLIDGRGIHIN